MKTKFSRKSKIIAIVIASVLTLTGTTYALAKKNENKIENAEKIWHDSFFISPLHSDIFAEMEAMEKHMNKMFEEHRKFMSEMFRNAENKGDKQQERSSLSLFQEDEFYRYELIFSSFKKEDVMINVENRVVTFAARRDEEKVSKKKGELRSSKNFYYSITLPENADDKPEIIREDTKITVKFRKKDSALKGEAKKDEVKKDDKRS